MDPHEMFDESGIRAAERRLEASLQAEDPTRWVYDYTEDAVFDGGGEHKVVGREALLSMARGMNPMRDVSIRPLRTEGTPQLATGWAEVSWTSGGSETGRPVEARGILVWRKEQDGRWRVAMEHLG